MVGPDFSLREHLVFFEATLAVVQALILGLILFAVSTAVSRRRPSGAAD
jgi:hypothetical protein